MTLTAGSQKDIAVGIAVISLDVALVFHSLIVSYILVTISMGAATIAVARCTGDGPKI